MNFGMTRPCSDCPFLRSGGIRLTPGRAREIAALMLDSQGGTFSCHKSVDYEAEPEDDDGPCLAGASEVHCAGALIFAEKHGTATQMMQIAERIGDYDPSKLSEEAKAAVFGSVSEMVAAQPKPRKKARAKS